MNYDPNWFYSSVAQCVAAVVGLLGAVLATRLQQQIGEVCATFDEVAKLLHILRDLLLRLAAVTQFREFAHRRIAEIQAALERGEAQLQVNQEIRFWGGTSSGSPWTIEVDDRLLANYEHLRRIAEPTISELQLHRSLATVQDARLVDAAIVKLQGALPSEGADGVITKLQKSIRAIEAANDVHLGRASVLIPAIFAAILGWLCTFGLIVPLAFLSAYASASKTSLLVASSLDVMAIPAYVGFELFRIARMKKMASSIAA